MIIIEKYCDTCGMEFDWAGVTLGDLVYCCAGCARGGPCICGTPSQTVVAAGRPTVVSSGGATVVTQGGTTVVTRGGGAVGGPTAVVPGSDDTLVVG